MPMLPQLQKMWESMVRSPTFGRVLDKCVLVKASNGTSIAEMTVGEEHTNAVGTLHGGMTATLVDIVSGFGLCTHPKHPAIGVTVDLNISYMAPANIGDVIVIESTTNKVGKTLAFLDIVVKNKTNGKLVAKGSHTKYIDVPNRINT